MFVFVSLKGGFKQRSHAVKALTLKNSLWCVLNGLVLTEFKSGRSAGSS